MESIAPNRPIRKIHPPYWIGISIVGLALLLPFIIPGTLEPGSLGIFFLAPVMGFIALFGIGCLIASWISRFRPIVPLAISGGDTISPRRILVITILVILFIAGVLFTLLKAEFVLGIYGALVHDQPFPAFDDSKAKKELQDRLDAQTAASRERYDQLTPDSEPYPSWIRTIPTPHGDLVLSFNGKFAKLQGILKSKCTNWVYDDTAKNTLNNVTFQFGYVALGFCPSDTPAQDQWIEVSTEANKDTYYTIKLGEDVVLSGDLHYGTLKYGQ